MGFRMRTCCYQDALVLQVSNGLILDLLGSWEHLPHLPSDSPNSFKDLSAFHYIKRDRI